MYAIRSYYAYYLKHGDFENAKLYAEETITWYQRAGYQRGVARATMDLANIAQLEGDFDQAGILFTEALSHLLRITSYNVCYTKLLRT